MSADTGWLDWLNPAVGMSHRYSVCLDYADWDFGEWSKVTGLSVTWQQIDYRVGEYGNRIWLYPGTTKYEPITLSRAIGPFSQSVQDWLNQVSQNPQPQPGSIQLVDYQGQPLITWNLNEFIPISWSVDSFDAAGGKPAIETLKLAHTGFLMDDIKSQAADPWT